MCGSAVNEKGSRLGASRAFRLQRDVACPYAAFEKSLKLSSSDESRGIRAAACDGLALTTGAGVRGSVDAATEVAERPVTCEARFAPLTSAISSRTTLSICSAWLESSAAAAADSSAFAAALCVAL